MKVMYLISECIPISKISISFRLAPNQHRTLQAVDQDEMQPEHTVLRVLRLRPDVSGRHAASGDQLQIRLRAGDTSRRRKRQVLAGELPTVMMRKHMGEDDGWRLTRNPRNHRLDFVSFINGIKRIIKLREVER
ncbi:hypothetical protein ANCCEY_05018 [Ancylostoma ceylanicum]|uniref:Uncharacterized protein n=1 Tax=Ancylostoma ceylanicum TaxID=53326 RepID=A0A0D6LXI7_9BILA|nr:hypothetical protein ANCCEY_05018 [Ancylostoma ceylanicum]